MIIIIVVVVVVFQFGDTGLSKARTNNHIEVVHLLQQPL